MKVLFIDPQCPNGHINFNKIHISAIKKVTDCVDVVLEKGYGDFITDNNIVYQYPKLDYKNNGLWNRIRIIKNWNNISNNVNFSKYDAIILSSYDEIAMSFIKLPAKSYLINHTNVSGIYNNIIKLWFFTLVSKKCTQIVLDPLSKIFLNRKGINKIITINHGLPSPFIKDYNWDLTRISQINKWSNIIFSPSKGSCDYSLIDKILFEHKFLKILENTNTLFILPYHIKIKHWHNAHPNVLLIEDRLTEHDYKNLFIRSRIIFIPYPKNFVFRSSGVFMEAISNNKDILVPANPAFNIYDFILTPDNYYNSTTDFINKVDNKLDNKSYSSILEYKCDCIRDPDYSFLLDVKK